MLALNTSASVVRSNGPKPGHHKGEWILVSWLRLGEIGHPDWETRRHPQSNTHRQTDSQADRQTTRQWGRQTDRLTDSRADRHLGSQTETWIVEGDQDVGWGLLRCSSLAVYDGEGHPLGLGDVIPHAACGVDDEAQHRSLGQAHQPGPEQSRGAWI